ncbi:hypothetical protein PAE0415 [Pyrobaculum aerophilum str. IM2]|uniref:Uncharacterized protein n=1 Tax=Pyrobaculum aerophilum (strain ATCC 51768 / DSM 7523 / JCM 9630 / CIP 104966 / NBRC 100827 / IM2) TaxID=178306 RepID=Q8ZZ66_PYRAE|nr:hypothetical protein PAE0415 [Pyrobaculum aerophilum str. IM2]
MPFPRPCQRQLSCLFTSLCKIFGRVWFWARLTLFPIFAFVFAHDLIPPALSCFQVLAAYSLLRSPGGRQVLLVSSRLSA